VPFGSVRVIKGPHICGDAIDMRVRTFRQEILSIKFTLYLHYALHYVANVPSYISFIRKRTSLQARG